MGTEQDDLQFFGFFDIIKESFKLIFAWRKLFTKITLAFSLPVYCISLANNVIYKVMQNKIMPNMYTSASLGDFVSSSIFKELLILVIYTIFSLIFSIILSTLSFATTAYTIECIYSRKEISFKKVLSVVPKVWKRFIITLLSFCSTLFLYTFVYIFVISSLVGVIFISFSDKSSIGGQLGIFVFVFAAIIFIVGLTWMCIIWQLSYVISILEKSSGFQAMTKSKKLLKGKMRTARTILVLFSACSSTNYFLLNQVQGPDGRIKFWKIISYGTLSLVWMTFLHLLNTVVQTVFYFVCKAYHHENIDKSLNDHVKVYITDDHVPLKAKNDGAD